MANVSLYLIVIGIVICISSLLAFPGEKLFVPKIFSEPTEKLQVFSST
jgi:hypothetical protein